MVYKRMKDMNKNIEIVTDEPTIIPIAAMAIDTEGVRQMARYVKKVRPECIPEEVSKDPQIATAQLFPHDMTAEPILPQGGTEDTVRKLTDNELLVELSGRKCYDSFGMKAGRKTNKAYIENTQAGEVPHGSIMYHAKMTFFIAGVSRRVSHELIRHYVGADRNEEGAPSQESTRYVEHSGRYIIHPTLAEEPRRRERFLSMALKNRAAYCAYIEEEYAQYAQEHHSMPRGMDKKRILESASAFLSHSVETSFIWTTNPIALAKLFKERDNDAADMEFQRFAVKWKAIAKQRWPNLFPQPWMQ